MKTLKCSDLGFTCEQVIRAQTVEEVMRQAADHAKTVHKVEVTQEQAKAIQQHIQDHRV